MKVILDPSCFYSLCSISRQVPVNLTSNHQACLPPSTSAVVSSVQVLIFGVLTGLSCESRSHDFLHPTEPSPTLEALSGHSTVYRAKSRQGGHGRTCSDPASLFISHLTTFHILCSDYTKFLVVSQKNSSKT